MVDVKPTRDFSAKFKENIDFLDALLADLQAIPIGGSTKTSRDPTDSPPPIPAPPREALSNGSARNTNTSLGNNLSELDSLLEDLNTTTLSKGKPDSTNSKTHSDVVDALGTGRYNTHFASLII